MSYVDHKLQKMVLSFLYRRRNETGMISFNHIVKKRGLPDPHTKITLAELERKELISLDVDYKKLGSTIDHHKFVVDELRLKGKITEKGIEKCKLDTRWLVPIGVSVLALAWTITSTFISKNASDARLNELEKKINQIDSAQKSK